MRLVRLWSRIELAFNKVDPHLARMSAIAKVAVIIAAAGWSLLTLVGLALSIWEADAQAGAVPFFGLIYFGLTVGAIWLLDYIVRGLARRALGRPRGSPGLIIESEGE